MVLQLTKEEDYSIYQVTHDQHIQSQARVIRRVTERTIARRITMVDLVEPKHQRHWFVLHAVVAVQQTSDRLPRDSKSVL